MLGVAIAMLAVRVDAHAPVDTSTVATDTTVRWLADPSLSELVGLESALRSHLATIDTTLDVSPLQSAPKLERAWIDDARARAQRDRVRAVFWIRRSDPTRVRLHLLDVDTGDVFVRDVDVPVDAGPAALDVLGLLVKSTMSELRDGAPIGMDRVTIAPVFPAPTTAAPPRSATTQRRRLGELRIAAGYVGTAYANAARWRSGGGLWLGWAFPFGLELALGYTPMQWTRAARDPSEIVVRRNPFELALGYAGRVKRVVLAGDLAFVVDRSVRVASTTDPSLSAEPKRGWWLFALAPRFRVEVGIVKWFGLFAAVGVEFWLNKVDFGVSAPAPAVLVSPWRIRPWLTVGPVFRVPFLGRPRHEAGKPQPDRTRATRKTSVRSGPVAAL